MKTAPWIGAIFLHAKPGYCPYLASQSKKAQSIDTTSAQAVAEQALQSLNQQFLETHHAAAQSTAIQIDYVLIYKLDELSLWKKEGDTYQKIQVAVPTDNAHYTRLKQMAHIPVLVTTLIETYLHDQQTHAACILQLDTVLQACTQMLKGLPSLFESQDLMGQQLLITHTADMIESLRQTQSKAEWAHCKESYIKNTQAVLRENSRRATGIQLQVLDRLMDQWGVKPNLACSRTVIVSPHGPKVGRIEAQYFNRLYQEVLGLQKVEDDWVYHIEMLPATLVNVDTLTDLIQGFLLGSELNKSIGQNLLGDSQSMFSDILKEYARPVLDQLFAKPTEIRLVLQ